MAIESNLRVVFLVGAVGAGTVGVHQAPPPVEHQARQRLPVTVGNR
jgi:hypothetical protein